MNELLKVNDEDMTVSARDLHEALGIQKRFSSWFETNSKDFVEGEDYTSVPTGTLVNNGAFRELDDYKLSVDMAKHLCLMSRTEKGKQCRQYLIDLEKAWNTPEQVFSRALKMADRTIASLRQQALALTTKNAEMKPKAEFFDAVAGSKDAIQMADVAKVLDMGIGRNQLFKLLRDKGILQQNNVPYQTYIDRGYFRVIEQKYNRSDGSVGINIKTLVYQKGVDFIRKAVAV